MHRPSARSLCLSLGVVAASVLPLAVAPGSVSADDGLRDRLERACARIEPARNRTNTVLARIDGGADVRGSLLWIQAQIDRAIAANRPARAAEIQKVYDLVVSRRALLVQRQAVLDQAAAVCESKGVTV
jgi:hypothetical protein